MTILKKIIDGKLPATIVYEDKLCLAIRDIAPQAPTHIILFPREEIRSMAEMKPEHLHVLGHMFLKAAEVAKGEGLAEGGYRLVVNTGRNGGQSIDHIHIHILGGRPMQWPPG